MLHIVGVLVSTLGWLLLYANATHFEVVADVKKLKRIERFIFWLRGREEFMKEIQDSHAEMANKLKGIPPKRHWRTEKTPKIIGVALVLIGVTLSIL